RIMKLLLLVFLMNKIVTLRCPASDAFLVPHEWYQTGDFIIGGMMSQIVYHFYEIKFNEHPSLKGYGLPLSFAQEEFETTKLSLLYCMVPNEDHQYAGVIQLLLHFGWTWIGVFTLDTNKGERFFQKLQSLLSQNGICIAFSQNIPQLVNLENISELLQRNSIICNKLIDQNANAFLVYGESFTILFFHFLGVMTIVSLDIGGKEMKKKNSVAMTVFNAWKGRFQIKWVDMDDCFECSEDHYPNKEKIECIVKPVVFLNIEENLGTDFLAVDVLFFLIFPVMKVNSLKCPEVDPFPVPHEWYQSGDVLIGGMASHNLYIPYGSFPPKEFHISNFSYFYFMAPNEGFVYTGIIQLLHHFGWKWVGLFAVENESGEHFLKKIQVMLSQHGICPAFIQRIPLLLPLDDIHTFSYKMKSLYIHLTDITANVFIVYGESYALLWLTSPIFLSNPEDKLNASFRKVWITTSQVDFILTGNLKTWNLQLFDGTISFQIHSGEVPAFKEFLKSIKPFWRKSNVFLKGFWEQAFDCFFSNSETPAINI
ncbi:hypothetical protein E2320_003540, partial [Naja naja]